MAFTLTNKNKFTAKCEAGLPGINQPTSIEINFKEGRVEIHYVYGFFKGKNIVLKPEDILDLSFDQETYRSAGKAAAGAIIGGLLTGGIGLLAGAALGGKRQKNNKLCLSIVSEGMSYKAIITSQYQLQDIYDRLAELMALKPATKPAGNDIVSQLKELNNLKEQGIITAKEFEDQKKKILN
jgi:hypothetical protein